MIILLLKLFIIALNIFYFPFKLLKTQNKITMISRQSNSINDDFRLLGEELANDFKIVYLCRTLKGGITSSFKSKISYGFHLFTQMYHLATSKVCILDSYCIAASVLKHKKSLKIVQIWHSIGTLKKFGWQITDLAEGSASDIAKVMKMHQTYDIVYCAAEAYKDLLAQGFNLPLEKFRVFTLPRVDLLKNQDYISKTRETIFEKYPRLKSKLNVVYAPTFRKDESSFKKYFSLLVKSFDFEKYNLIVKLHPLSTVEVCDERVIIDKNFTAFQMLTVANRLISDFSCIIYEAGIMEIPLYFYNYDMESYCDARSLTVDYDDLPGIKTADAEKLNRALSEEYDFDVLKKYINKYIENTEHCTEKMAEDIKLSVQ